MPTKLVGLQAFRQGDNVIITDDDGSAITDDYLTELVTRYKGCQVLAYDVDLLAACLMKAIGITEKQAWELHKTEHLQNSPWRITYFPKKFLGIDYSSGRDHPEINIGNCDQAGYADVVYDALPMDLGKAIGNAKEAMEVGLDIRRIFGELGLDSTNINSPATAFLQKYKLNWVTVNEMPPELVQMSIDAVKGHQFEVYTLGTFTGESAAFDYDKNAAYLHYLSELPDLRRGEFVYMKGNEIPDGATLGVARGILSTKASLHPFLVQVGETNYTPTGKMPNTLTLFDIKFMKEYKLAEFEIQEGFYWIPIGVQYHAYRGAMLYLWRQKQNSEGRKKLIIQRIYSSLVGKQIQGLANYKFGKMFNPFVPALVEAATRIDVIKTCLDYKVKIIAITGDGFVSSTKVDLPLSDDLGGWKLKQHADCLSIGSNAVVFKDGKSRNDYDDLIASMTNNPKSETYSKMWHIPVSLGMALQHNFEDLGLIKPLEREYSIDIESKRLYPIRPKNGEALLHGKFHSIAWDYDTLLAAKKGI